MESHFQATQLKSLDFCGDGFVDLDFDNHSVSEYDFKAHGSTILCQKNSNFYVANYLLISESLYSCHSVRSLFIIISPTSYFVCFPSPNFTNFC